jgi:hypothetical protein
VEDHFSLKNPLNLAGSGLFWPVNTRQFAESVPKIGQQLPVLAGKRPVSLASNMVFALIGQQQATFWQAI